jgi:hypothetical protein
MWVTKNCHLGMLPLNSGAMQAFRFCLKCWQMDLVHGTSLLLDYILYIQTVFRLAANYVWQSVLLYHSEYREKQLKHGYAWNTPCVQLREFNFIPKRDNSTVQSLLQITKQPTDKSATSDKSQPGGPLTVMPSKLGRGPFLPNGREICRRFNNDN